jgi:hypothetical protein
MHSVSHEYPRLLIRLVVQQMGKRDPRGECATWIAWTVAGATEPHMYDWKTEALAFYSPASILDRIAHNIASANIADCHTYISELLKNPNIINARRKISDKIWNKDKRFMKQKKLWSVKYTALNTNLQYLMSLALWNRTWIFFPYWLVSSKHIHLVSKTSGVKM